MLQYLLGLMDFAFYTTQAGTGKPGSICGR
jgi:hypothetical protein